MRHLRSLACLAVMLAACGDDIGSPAKPDAARLDAAVTDAAVTDAATPDAATADARPIDANPIDASVIDAIPADANVDATPPDATIDTSGEIATARATVDGSGLSLPIERAIVTYLKPALGSDPAGFTVQALQQGPALFIAVDPTTLTPAPARGDTVTFTITAMGTLNGLRQATAITDFARNATGVDVNTLSQDVSAATDLVSGLDGYESELVDLTATLAGSFVSAGPGFEKATLTSAGITGDPNLTVRVPSTLRDGLDLVTGCALALDNVPVGRLATQAQVGAFVAGDMVVTDCPAPTVVSAVAIASNMVQVTFSRHLQASSVAVDGSQFTFDNGLTAQSASATGKVVTLVTSEQTGGTAYLATVANTVTDQQGTALGAPLTATFTGFQTLALVRINEVNANLAGGCDLIELRVTSGGTMTGYKLQERDTANLLTFPTFTVATNDLIVVHMSTASATCNPGTAVNETGAIDAQPRASFGANYDTAFDFYSSDAGLTATDNVFTLYNNAGTILDAVFVSSDPASPFLAAAGTETQAAAVVAAGQWTSLLVPPTTTYVDAEFHANACKDLDGTGTTAVGSSIQRTDDTDDNTTDDWGVVTSATTPASTWGALNAGQAAL